MADQRTNTLSRRQLAILLWAVMVSPLIRQVPGTMTALGGRAVWLSVLLAVPAVLLLGWFIAVFLRSRREGEGLGELICRSVGQWPGRIVTGVFALWLTFYAGFVLRAGADRFVSAVFPDSPVWLFMAVTLLICLPAGLGRLKTLARCAQVTTPLLAAVFALVFLFCFQNVEPDNLWPLQAGDLPGAAEGALPLLTTLSVGVYLAFLTGKVESGKLFASFILPLLVLTGLGFLLCVTTIGTFGEELTEEMNYPFFVMIRSIRIFNLLERVEALVVAQWVVADFLLLGTLLQIGPTLFTLTFYGQGQERKPLTEWLCVGLLGLTAVFCAPTAFALRWVAQTVIPMGNAALVFGVLPLIFLIGKLRKRL